MSSTAPIYRATITCKLLGKIGDTCPDLNLHSLEHRRTISGLCQIHRMVSGVAPSSVRQLLPPFMEPARNSRYVDYSHHLQLTISRSKTEHHQKSFLPKFARCWNCIPSDCIYGKNGDLSNLQSFKVSANRWLLSLV